MKIYKYFLLFSFIFLCGFCFGILSNFYFIKDKVAEGVCVGNVNVGGYSKLQLEKMLQDKINEKLNNGLFLIHKNNVFEIKIKQPNVVKYDIKETVQKAYLIGRDGNFFEKVFERYNAKKNGINLDLVYFLNEEKLNEIIDTISKDIYKESKNAYFISEKGDIKNEEEGEKLNATLTLKEIKKWFGTLENKYIALKVEKIKPEILAEDLKKINFNKPLSTYTTYFNPGEKNRSHNIRISAAALNKYFLRKNEVLSYNKVVGPRYLKYGFLEAPVLIKGRFVPREGGGICQVSTTLFNAALLAGLEIKERTNHSRPVKYVPVGFDATAVYPSLDLKIKNSIGQNVVIFTNVEGGKITISIYGENPNNVSVKISSFKKITKDAGVEEIQDPKLEAGKKIVKDKGNPGYVATITRLVKIKDEERKDIFRSSYKPYSRIVIVGTKEQEIPSSTDLTPLLSTP